jgi:hypothetical protein
MKPTPTPDGLRARLLRYRLGVSITETILVFVCIPLAVVLVVYALVYGTSAARSRRYRPGRPFEPAAVWYTAGGSAAVAADATEARELTASGDGAAAGGEWPAVRRTGETGGASDSW